MIAPGGPATREPAERVAALRARLDQAEVELLTMQERHASQARLLMTVSHDLRQPLQAVALCVGALQSVVLPDEASRLVGQLARSLQGLDRLCERLLDLSRLDHGDERAVPTTVDAAALLGELAERFQPLAHRRGLRLAARAPRSCWIRTDPAVLVEILMNLLSNAFRFTDRGGLLLSARHRGESVRIEVWDTGHGIAEPDLSRIFEEFVQLRNPSRDPRRGYGLGLPIARRLAGLLESSIEVRSRPGRGTVFSIELPRAPHAPDTDEHVEPEDAVLLAGAMLLVVDDSVEVLLALHAQLDAWGCLVLLARTAKEAAGIVARCDRYPDVLITDHDLGGEQTSADVTAAVRAEMQPVRLPVVVLTAGRAEVESFGPSGADAVLEKPVAPSVLRAHLVRLLDSAARSRCINPEAEA